MGGLQSSAFLRDSTTASVTISSGTKILENDIEVTTDMLGSSSSSGVFRLWFSFTTASEYQITVTKNGAADLTGSPLKVHADLDFVLQSTGYYRFDIAVNVGDLINLSSDTDITAVNELTIQQVQIGA